MSHAVLSPRARGRRGLRENRGSTPGTIPACAGPTARPEHHPHPDGDYPGVRGADLWVIDPKGGMEGLSPRARGRPVTSVHALGGDRTIPACAGPTADRSS